MLQISAEDIYRALPMAECIEVVENAMREVSRGTTLQPDRWIMPLGTGNAMGIMPGAMKSPAIHGIKLISLYPNNPARGLSSHQGAMVLFDSETGTPVAILDASALTAQRTAAASAAATRALARTDARVLAILGSGEQAAHHLPGLLEVRAFEKVRVWSRTPAHARAFVERHGDIAPSLETRPSAREAVEGADVIVTVTASPEPILEGAWLEPGQHVNLVGSSTAGSREVDEEGVARGRFFADCRAAVESQAGELLVAIRAGRVELSHIVGEIGAVYEGNLAGRSGEDEITIYKSLGTAAQDLAAAHAVWRRVSGGGEAGP